MTSWANIAKRNSRGDVVSYFTPYSTARDLENEKMVEMMWCLIHFHSEELTACRTVADFNALFERTIHLEYPNWKSHTHQMLTCCLRMIHCENWIEPIPDHMRTKYLEWKVSEKNHALRQRGMAESRSRHILCEEYDDDTEEMLIGLASRSNTFYGREPPDREAPYSDYELEVLAKLDVNREMIREHFPAGMMRYAPSERQAFRAIVYASRTIFYGINYDDDDVFNPNPKNTKNTKNTTFYIDRIGPPHANFDGDNPWSYFSGRDECDETGTYNPYGISETDPIVVEYQTRVLTKMNEMKKMTAVRNRGVECG